MAGVGKAALNLIKITELSARAVRQEGLDGGAWAGGGWERLHSIFNKTTELSALGAGGWGHVRRRGGKGPQTSQAGGFGWGRVGWRGHLIESRKNRIVSSCRQEGFGAVGRESLP